VHYDTVVCLRIEENDFSPDGLVADAEEGLVEDKAVPALSRFGEMCAAMPFTLPKKAIQLLFAFLTEPYGAEIRAIEIYPYGDPRAYATLARTSTRQNPHWITNVRRIEKALAESKGKPVWTTLTCKGVIKCVSFECGPDADQPEGAHNEVLLKATWSWRYANCSEGDGELLLLRPLGGGDSCKVSVLS
jgi:hypothetical protein